MQDNKANEFALIIALAIVIARAIRAIVSSEGRVRYLYLNFSTFVL